MPARASCTSSGFATTLRVVAVLLVVAVVGVSAGRDFYKILGISRNASARDIKKAYRKLSKEHHPDIASGNRDENEKKFMEITNAYEVLSDDEKRRIYDQRGEEGLKQHQQGGGGGGNPFDIFSNFGFGGGGRGKRKGATVAMELSVTLEDLYNGKVIEAELSKQILCPKCRGTGARDEHSIKKCSSCGGKGIKLTTRTVGPGFVQQFQSTCDVCGGTGKTVAHKCSTCQGHKVVRGDNTITIDIERGMRDGKHIVFENQGDQHPDIEAGDVEFILRTQPHPVFRRDGDDLRHDMTISLAESLLGFKRELEHLDGHKVLIDVKGVTKPQQTRVYRDEGMPHHQFPSDKGKLYVTFFIQYPDKLTPEQEQGIRKLFAS